MNCKFPIENSILDQVLQEKSITNLDSPSIRDIVDIVDILQEKSAVEFLRMEIGSPGLPSPEIGIKAQQEALSKGVSMQYASVHGIPELKKEASRFVKSFVGIDVPPASCVTSVGSMQGGMVSMIAAMHAMPERDTLLFIDPGFAVQKLQCEVMRYKYVTFDIYEHRSEKLEAKLREMITQNKLCALIYSNPNNPTWMCLTEKELEVIGRLATEFDLLVIEDLAYFCMDFRLNLADPTSAPYQPTVARYTDNYVMHISSSKTFSYAGERISLAVISPKLYQRNFENYRHIYNNTKFGTVYINGILYALSSGCSHSAQYALCAMMKAASDGAFDFVSNIKEYGNRAKRLKKIFLQYGFNIPYELDGEQPIADGFFFTLNYGEMTSHDLLYNLLRHGISATTLKSTGAEKSGIRACTSMTHDLIIDQLEERLTLFTKEFPI